MLPQKRLDPVIFRRAAVRKHPLVFTNAIDALKRWLRLSGDLFFKELDAS
jgi:hypothetical protein